MKQTKMDSSLVFGRKLLSYQDNLCWKPFPLLKMFIRNTVEMAENAMAILSKSEIYNWVIRTLFI